MIQSSNWLLWIVRETRSVRPVLLGIGLWESYIVPTFHDGFWVEIVLFVLFWVVIFWGAYNIIVKHG